MIRGGFVTLFVRDVGHAVRFYVETLGMKLVEEADDVRAVIDAGEGFRITLQQGTRPEGDGRGAVAPLVVLCPKVPIGEAVAIYENRGVAFDVKDDGRVTVARFHDPDGNALALRQER
jgi:catechol 2,3-dioxygenase-like lactoylglutathione lyase family enzyme